MNNLKDGARNEYPDTIKIIGIGQSLRGDDAAGLAAVQLWYDTYQAIISRPNVLMELAELPGLGLLSLLEGARIAILVDAVKGNSATGMVQVFTENQLESFRDGSGSAHGWGVAETLSLGRKLNVLAYPEKLILIGIETGQLNLGEKLSPAVEAALPEVVNLIEQFINAEYIQK